MKNFIWNWLSLGLITIPEEEKVQFTSVDFHLIERDPQKLFIHGVQKKSYQKYFLFLLTNRKDMITSFWSYVYLKCIFISLFSVIILMFFGTDYLSQYACLPLLYSIFILEIYTFLFIRTFKIWFQMKPLMYDSI